LHYMQARFSYALIVAIENNLNAVWADT